MPIKKNSIYIATSLDGFIADEDGSVDWLNNIPNPDEQDMGFYSFMDNIDALVMGRNTFETVLYFDIEWPYFKHVFVLSSKMKDLPKELNGKVSLLTGTVNDILKKIHSEGYYKLYIDGGKTIQSFLNNNLIDEIIITIAPIILGKGIRLFSNNDHMINFNCIKTELFNNGMVQNHFILK